MGLEEATENLFSYGTLQQESVQLATFGRKLDGAPDDLIGYEVTTIPIRDPSVVATSGATHYRNVRRTGEAADSVEGTVFRVTREELERADAYERVADYERVLVRLRSGTSAWVYLNVPR